jgi:hypothetical protein
MPELESPAMGMPFQLAGALLEIYVFRAVVGGVTWYVAARSTAAGEFTLIFQDTVPGVVINAALAEADLTGLGEVTVCGAAYPLEVSVAFPADSLTLTGMGRSTFLDGDALTTGNHAIVIDGYNDCVVRDLAVQTEDGGGKECYCIFIDDSHRYRIEGVWILASDDCGINVRGPVAGVVGGIITFCFVTGCDTVGIDIEGLGTDAVEVSNNIVWDCLDGIRYEGKGDAMVDVYANICYNNTGNGINLTTETVSHDAQIVKNICWANNRGIVVEGDFENYEIKLNYAVNNTSDGIVAGINYPGCGDISDNYSIGNGASGIRLEEAVNLKITTNYCIDNTADGIRLTANVDNCWFQGNYCTDNGGYGINILNANCNDNFVGKNYLTGNTTGCINDAGTDTRLPEVTVVVSDPDGNIGRHAAIVLTDGVDVTCRFEIKIPSHFQELVRARIVLVAGGTGNLRRSVNTEFGKVCADEAYNTHTDSIAAGEVAVTLNELECVDVAAAFTGIAQNDLVGLEFTRHGSHANDTVNANCYLLAFNMQYV